ncbi:MAG: TIGR03790 family protein [Candidatus Thiodiazotropha sp. (ex Ctena orbiculata)]|nr:TIGR03790 family protein [Candidatus Thiodiazotropha taylori]MBT2998440.1 TIGR03790 family protein [Candidatus Thiodiazotropha taylori]MBT3002660.1 TIGR03790 family protein [Candidatus Thiodiazotropha taylori]MBV2109061.1 TIGR03790 family protein [Candidatus Thiodiazotropha taylori]MBV2112958.1 TIGR03790 family protein [Candidatus Thiodiazotropha taylori]
MDWYCLTHLNLKPPVFSLQHSLLSLVIALFVSPTLQAEVNLFLPKYRLEADELAIVVNDRDPLSVRIGEYYLRARVLPEENLLHLAFDSQRVSLSPAAFRLLREELLRNTPEQIQAYALTWRTPYRVGCMSMTSAITFGFDRAWCSDYRCATTRHSPYYNYQGANPLVDLSLRPSMLIAAENFTDAKDLIDRGLAADASLPRGTAYLVNTRDHQRGVRAFDYPRINRLMQGWIDSEIIDQDSLRNRDDVLFYFTGTTRVPGLETLGFRPGAIADHLTSAGGQLVKSKQMSALEWLKAGASGSYGTVVEPCNHLGKFPSPALVMEHYGSGSTLIEAYWKSVQQPGEGVFIGDPLAAPFDHLVITQTDRETRVETRNLKPGSYRLMQAPSPIGPFVPVSNLLARYHQTLFSLPRMGREFYRLQLVDDQ